MKLQSFESILASQCYMYQLNLPRKPIPHHWSSWMFSIGSIAWMQFGRFCMARMFGTIPIISRIRFTLASNPPPLHIQSILTSSDHCIDYLRQVSVSLPNHSQNKFNCVGHNVPLRRNSHHPQSSPPILQPRTLRLAAELHGSTYLQEFLEDPWLGSEIQ